MCSLYGSLLILTVLTLAAGMSSCPRTLKRVTRPTSRSRMLILISTADAADVYVVNSLSDLKAGYVCKLFVAIVVLLTLVPYIYLSVCNDIVNMYTSW